VEQGVTGLIVKETRLIARCDRSNNPVEHSGITRVL
jgi:hypothetical protein